MNNTTGMKITEACRKAGMTQQQIVSVSEETKINVNLLTHANEIF